jgi:N utilization substance protein A
MQAVPCSWKSLTWDEEIADLLIAEGFISLEQVAYVPLEEMLEIESFDEDTVNELRTRAKDALLTMEIANEESVDEIALELGDLHGLSAEHIAVLADNGVHSLDDLADLAIDELTEMTGHSVEEATSLIMKARAHWFTGDVSSQA